MRPPALKTKPIPMGLLMISLGEFYCLLVCLFDVQNSLFFRPHPTLNLTTRKIKRERKRWSFPFWFRVDSLLYVSSDLVSISLFFFFFPFPFFLDFDWLHIYIYLYIKMNKQRQMGIYISADIHNMPWSLNSFILVSCLFFLILSSMLPPPLIPPHLPTTRPYSLNP